MSSPRKSQRRRFPKHGKRPSPLIIKKPEQLCALCNKPIKDIHTAIACPPASLPGHFDCVLKKVSDKLAPNQNETVIYLGKERFAVVDTALYKEKRLKIIRTLDWELDQEEAQTWRQKLKTDIH